MFKPVFFLMLASPLLAQAVRPNVPAPPPPAEAPKPAPAQPIKEAPPIVTKHSISAGGKTLNYTATAGMMPIRNETTGEVEANIFYVAYTLDGAERGAARPLTFSFNGGPGSASVWLHMGAIGPRRVRMNDDGSLPAPPYRMEDNQSTWLDKTDIVFIDPVGTGFSRAAKPELNKQFFNIDGDIASVGEFVRLYLTHNNRWSSPLFLAGESYGTTRAAGLSGYLVDHGIALNGIVLVSTVLNFETLIFTKGNDLPYSLILPTYTATAFYHKKLASDLQTDLRHTLKQAEAFALGEYTDILARGDHLTPAERQAAVTKIARFTGLSEAYVDQSDLRIEIMHFIKELLRDRKLTVGRLDARITGVDGLGTSERPDFDPSMTAIRPPYTAAFNSYVRGELKYETDLTYYLLGGGVTGWDWGRAQNSFADTSEALRSAFAKNPYMKLFVGYGYFDMATPYLAAQYTLSHAGLTPANHKNVTERYYEAGHMFYINVDSLRQFKKDVDGFLAGALETPAGQ